jgi:hypothetical protein
MLESQDISKNSLTSPIHQRTVRAISHISSVVAIVEERFMLPRTAPPSPIDLWGTSLSLFTS